MENKDTNCACGSGDKIVFSCSGASDVGLLSDKVSRCLQFAGKRKMSCLAMVGADMEKSIANFKSKNILMIDGCPLACGKKILDNHEFNCYQHFIITENGMKKGETPANDENVKLILEKTLDL